MQSLAILQVKIQDRYCKNGANVAVRSFAYSCIVGINYR